MGFICILLIAILPISLALYSIQNVVLMEYKPTLFMDWYLRNLLLQTNLKVNPTMHFLQYQVLSLEAKWKLLESWEKSWIVDKIIASFSTWTRQRNAYTAYTFLKGLSNRHNTFAPYSIGGNSLLMQRFM